MDSTGTPSTTQLSVETQLALINQTMNQTKDDVKEIKTSLKGLTDNVIRKSDLIAITDRLSALEKDRDLDRARFEQHILDYAITKNESSTVKKIVYGAVGVVLTAVLLAIVGLVIVVSRH